MLMIWSCPWATAILVPSGTQCMAIIITWVAADVNIIGYCCMITTDNHLQLRTTTILECGCPWATVSKCDLSITANFFQILRYVVFTKQNTKQLCH